MLHGPAPKVGRAGAAVALAAAVLAAAALGWTGRPPEAGLGWRVAFVAVHLGATAALVAWLRLRSPGVALVVVGAVAVRLVVLPMSPGLSDDGYRYLWDGGLVLEGVSPYAHRPSDPALEPYRPSPLVDRMNSPDYHSVYPPASQAVFAAAATADGWQAEWIRLKLLLLVFEAIGIAALLAVFGPRWAALYAWSPLAVVEIAGQGHTEALVVAGLGALFLVGRARWPVASVGLTVAGLAKLYPLALLPAAWRREGWGGVAASVVLAVALSVPVWHPDALEHARESLSLFFGTFDEYAAPYRALKAALYPVLGEGAGRAASGALAGLFALAVGWTWLSDDGTDRATLRISAVVIVGFALSASTLHPWYWVPIQFVMPLLHHRLFLWLATLASASYIGYQIPGAEDVAMLVGWGGALVIALAARYGQGPAASSTRPTSADVASSHTASG